jgi:hypothetical protein
MSQITEAQRQWVETVLGVHSLPPTGQTEGAVVRLAKGMQVWNATRGYVARQIKTLKDAIVAQTANEPDFDVIQSNLVNLDVLLEVLDDRLIGKMNELRGTTDAAAKTKITEEARAVVVGYQKYLAEDKLVNDIDANGFVATDIKAKVSATLDEVLRVI